MTKAKYLELIKEIGKAVRTNNIHYGRIFSDKRKSTGYRTKFWYIFGGNVNDVAAIAKSIGGDCLFRRSRCHYYSGGTFLKLF